MPERMCYLAGPTIYSQVQLLTIKQKKQPSDLLTSGKRWLRDISETIIMTPMRSDGVVLGSLLQATRGILLFVFNWTLFIRFGQTIYIPGVDIMVALPTSMYFLIGFIDILMVKRVWRGDHNGWRYGIAMSMLILLLVPTAALFYLPLHILFLHIVIDLFAVAEIIVLVIPETHRFYQT